LYTLTGPEDATISDIVSGIPKNRSRTASASKRGKPFLKIIPKQRAQNRAENESLLDDLLIFTLGYFSDFL
jgi:hypothetical protein